MQADDILEALSTVSPASRRWFKLMFELQNVSAKIGMDVLRDDLRSTNRKACAGAQQVLVSLGTQEAIDALAESLDWADSVAVCNASRLLARMQARSAVPSLIACLGTRRDELNGTAKQWLSRTLGLMPHRDAVPVLAETLLDPSSHTRTAAAGALARIRAPESRIALEGAANQLSWFRGRAVRRALNVVLRNEDFNDERQ
jgi:HEAT repeat protein